MKTNFLMLILAAFFLQIGTSCSRTKKVTVVKPVVIKTTTTTKSKPLPPGQAKKLTGSQSAKPYAPGQQKKH